jgi:acyl carrier protein
VGRGIGLDSVEMLSVIMAVEEEFDLALEDDDLKIEHFRTLGALASFVAEKLP